MKKMETAPCREQVPTGLDKNTRPSLACHVYRVERDSKPTLDFNQKVSFAHLDQVRKGTPLGDSTGLKEN